MNNGKETGTKLLTRDQFREGTFARDKNKCVMCEKPAKDAHHILERRLWPDSGYYLNNGASVCEEHHIQAEQTVLSCEELRQKCGITKVVLPPHLYSDETWDKWGNLVLENGQRLRGELFFDASVQKILAPVLHLFTNRVKYPRTYHLPWSPGVGKDDRVLESLSSFEDQRVIVTVKMDGENTTMYSDHIHARSVTSGSHPTRSWVKSLHGKIKGDIPEDWRVCGENLFAKHSIEYDNLPSYFQMFSIWNERNVCLSWDETKEYAQLLGLDMVPVLYDGLWDINKVKGVLTSTFQGNECEGYVVRVADAFTYGEFRSKVGKYVRVNHNQCHGGWMRAEVIQNGLS